MARWFTVVCLTAFLVGFAAATPNSLIVKQHAMIGNLGTVTGGAGVVDNGVFAEKGEFSSITADQVQLQGNPAIVGNLVVDTQAVEFTSVEAEDADIGNAQADVGTINQMTVDELTINVQFTSAKVDASLWTSNTATIVDAAITTLKTEDATITKAIVGDADIETADIQTAEIVDLTADTATIATGTFANLDVSVSLVVSTSGSASVNTLDVVDGTVETLTAQTATVGTLSGTTMTYDTASGDKVVAENAVIEQATIVTLDSTTANIDAANIVVGDITDATISFATIDSLQVTTANVIASATFNEIDTESFVTGSLESTNTAVSGTLKVEGDSTFNSGLVVNGAFTVTGAAEIMGNINIDGILSAVDVKASSAAVTGSIGAATVSAVAVEASTFTGASATLTGSLTADSASVVTTISAGIADVDSISAASLDIDGLAEVNKLVVGDSASVTNAIQANGTAQFATVSVTGALDASTAELTSFQANTATIASAEIENLSLTSAVSGSFSTATFSGDVQFDAAVVVNGAASLQDVAVNGALESTTIEAASAAFNFVTVTDGVVANALSAQTAVFESLRATDLTTDVLQADQIVGDVTFADNVDVNGALAVNTLTGATVIAENLDISNTLTAGNVSLSGSAQIAAATITELQANTATIKDATVSGELSFTGVAPVVVDEVQAKNTLVTGQFDVMTSLDVTGTMSATDVTVSNTASVATLVVDGTGTTTLNDLTVNGAFVATADAEFQAALSVAGNLMTSQFDVTGTATVGGSAEVSGLITGNDGIEINGGDSTIDVVDSFKITSDGVTWVDLDTSSSSPQLTIGDENGSGAIDFEGVTRIPVLSAGGTSLNPVVSVGLGSFSGNGDFVFTNPAADSAAEEIFTVRTDNNTNVDLFSVATTDAVGTVAVTYDVDTFEATVSDRLDLNTTSDTAALVMDAAAGTIAITGDNGVDLQGPVTARPTGALSTTNSLFRVCATSACDDNDLLFDARADSVRFGAPLHFYSALSHSVNLDASIASTVVSTGSGLATYTITAAVLFGNQFFNFRNIGPVGVEQTTAASTFQILFPALSQVNFGQQGSIALQGKVITLMGYEKIPDATNGNWISAAGFPIESSGFSALWAAAATDTFPVDGSNQWLSLDSNAGVFANGNRDGACSTATANRDAWSLTLLITAPEATANAALGTYDETAWQLVYTPIQFAAQPLASVAAEYAC